MKTECETAPRRQQIRPADGAAYLVGVLACILGIDPDSGKRAGLAQGTAWFTTSVIAAAGGASASAGKPLTCAEIITVLSLSPEKRPDIAQNDRVRSGEFPILLALWALAR
jgi:hypothetical protein